MIIYNKRSIPREEIVQGRIMRDQDGENRLSLAIIRAKGEIVVVC